MNITTRSATVTLVGTLMLAMPHVGMAEHVSIQFGGTVETAGTVGGVPVAIGETFAGSFTYDLALPDFAPNQDFRGAYLKEPVDFDFVVSFSGGASSNSLVTERESITLIDSNFSVSHGTEIDGFFSSPEYSDDSRWEIFLVSTNLTLFTSDSLPSVLPSLDSFDLDRRLVTLQGNLPSGPITSLSQVPIPASLALLGTALVWLVIRFGRIRSSLAR